MAGPILITGAHGFVGRHLRRELGRAAVAADADVTDAGAVTDAVRAARPRAVVHLAARSSVESSWDSPEDVWRVNTIGTVNVLEAVGRHAPGARLLLASTAEVYGRAAATPTAEDASLAPLSPYAASKAAAEVAAEQKRRTDRLDVVVARAFPHVGTGQHERFAVGSWTRQIARLETAGGGSLRVGDLSVERDLVDVRDVCRAYRLLLDTAVVPGVYNVCSGRTIALEDAVELLVRMARCPVAVERDPTRVRGIDIPVLCGDPARLEAATGWKPRIPLETTLADALDEARRVVSAEEVVRA